MPNGIDAAYATFDDYQNRENVSAALEDEIDAMILAMSRSLDRRLGVIPGGFAPLDDGTFEFYGQGGRSLWLRDAGYVFPLRSVIDDGIVIDDERSGDFANASLRWDFDDRWVETIPHNCFALGEPARGIRLRRYSSSPRTRWPYDDASVRITGDWGWAVTPPAIVELVIKRVRDMRDTQRGGAASNVADIGDAAIPFFDDSWRLWAEVQSRYSYVRAPLVGRRTL